MTSEAIAPGTTGDPPSEQTTGIRLEPAFPEAQPREKKARAVGGARGRPRKGKVDTELLATQLVGTHKLLATLARQPVLEIDKDEGKALAKAVGDIIEEYSLAASKRMMLWINFVTVVCMIYGPKLLILRAQANSRKTSVSSPKEKPPPSAIPGLRPQPIDFSALG